MSQTTGFLAQASDELAGLVARVLTGVVSLHGDEGERKSNGSGFVFDAQGHVVTNHHVVQGFTGPMRAVATGTTTQEATILGTDEHTDLAVLRLERPAGTPLPLRESPARLGELCLGVGTPYGIYPESVSFGVVSGLRRDIPQEGRRPLEDTLQTDIAINPGNSGGPLVDMAGLVLGVNVCIDSRGQNIGFAIPAETVGHVVAEIVADGRVRRAALGLGVANVMVDEGGTHHPQLVVTRVASDGPCSALTVGDVIERLDGVDIRERADLYRLLTKDRIGKKASLQVRRGEGSLQVDVQPRELTDS